MSNYCKTIVALLASLVITNALAADVPGGGVLFVDDDAGAGGDGLTWDTAYPFLQDALTTASQGGISEIHVAQGTYKPDRTEANPTGTGDREATFHLLNNVSLRGGYAGIGEDDPDARDIEQYETILNADLLGNDVPGAGIDDSTVIDNSFHILVAEDVEASSRLDGFSIVGGTANSLPFPNDNGGGIFINAASPIIENCKFVENKGLDGGAVRVVGNKVPWFVNCDFFDNYTNLRGGALKGFSTVISCEFVCNYAGLDGGATYRSQLIIECTFVNNISLSNGGAIWTNDAQIVDCTFLGNSAGEKNGNIVTEGGAIFCKGSSEITNCVFTDNKTQEGGGAAIFNQFGNIVVKDCAFTNNLVLVSGSGGAIAADDSMEIINCSFVGNSAVQGGAINAPSGSITDCIFLNNSSSLRGGAIYTSSSLDILNCGFLGNSSAENGGALYVVGSSNVFVDNGEFSGNEAALAGGAIHSASVSTSIQIVNCSINANTSGSNGGGLFNNSGTADITNSIFWNNSDGVNGSNEAAQIFNGPIGTLSINYSLIENLTGDLGGLGNIADDPLFIDADGADNIPGTIDDDLHLMPGSPCIDAGNNWGVPEDANDYDEDNILCELFPVDLDGNPRFNADETDFDPGCGIPVVVDMGAYEYQFDPVDQVIFADINADGLVNTADLLSLFASWGNCNICCIADLDISGNVDTSDLLILFTNWGCLNN